MGLDIVMYGKSNEKLGLKEIDYFFYEALFIKNENWRSYSYLRKISDYYLTDIMFNREEINHLLNDFRNIRMFIPIEYQSSIDKLVDLLSDININEIHIAGD
ncbi:hypothetical protein QUF86_10390 [Peribacillus sp. NJ11]|uniref:hypothetical protein n=1 Tax=Peribacillus sp. NJ11 TaxID=3055861 RepID=UPI0025A213DE|nr:hypothetical protein [Peribacillus sp. NJ11]MDM5221125.1 hypothetical protein [Peribacillus sp. NJ11]